MTPQQQADEMARKCANDLQKYTGQDQTTNELIAKQIIQSTNLVQLLECVEALREAKIHFAIVTPEQHFGSIVKIQLMANALTNLDRAMKGDK